MATEIERKFLVTNDGWRTAEPRPLRQGYLSRQKDCSVRVRIDGEIAFLTVKGLTVGAARREYEYQIDRLDAEEMLTDLCQPPVIHKHRHTVWHAGNCWEIDEFFGENAGLVVAEIELQSETQSFEHPAWLGAEVTSDPRYFNANLALHPFAKWSTDA
ncbi:MAG: CYTH domain-containing protein [Planctomycetales bacterium]|nr:CYTH domain-containing protein [Planctomycetales bacterium]MCA9168568.1 CYTH domain-containing protein [Planctomycetales bacterium]